MAHPSKALKEAQEEAAAHILEHKAEQKAEEAIKAAMEKKAEQLLRSSRAPRSVERNCSASKEEVADLMKNVSRWYGRKRVKTSEEIIERIQEFFDTVTETGEIPTIEKFCLALGICRRTFDNWRNGEHCDKDRQEEIQRVWQALAAVDAELVVNGKLVPVVYIFRAKNFWDMKDQNETIITPNNPIGADVPESELRKRIEENIVQDAEFTDA